MPQSTNSTNPVEDNNGREESNCLPDPSQTRTAVNSPQCSNTNSAHATGVPPQAPNAPPSTTSTSPPEMPPAGLIKGSPSSYVAGIVEWTFPESQSNILGRTGSNACAFIALLMGKVWMGGHLLWPTGDNLPDSCRKSLLEAMTKGNKIHGGTEQIMPCYNDRKACHASSSEP